MSVHPYEEKLRYLIRNIPWGPALRSGPCRKRQSEGYGVCGGEMIDPSRPVSSRADSRRQSDDAQWIQAEGRPLKVRRTAACSSTRAWEEPVQSGAARKKSAQWDDEKNSSFFGRCVICMLTAKSNELRRWNRCG